MHAVRLLLAQRRIAVLICAAALLMKLLVPAGYMIADAPGRIALTICSGTGPAAPPAAMRGMGHSAPDHGRNDGGKAQMPCAFSSLSAPALGAIDPVQLALFIAFVMATGLARVPLPAPSGPAYLRPPLRGPPAAP